MTIANVKSQEITVLLSAGSIGQAIIRRVASGRRVLLGDLNQDNLDRVTESLLDAGFEVETKIVDASKRDSIRYFAQYATSLGEVNTTSIQPECLLTKGSHVLSLMST